MQFKGDLGEVTDPDPAKFTLGDHPIAKQIASLQLKKTPNEITYGVNMRAILHPYEKNPSTLIFHIYCDFFYTIL